MSDWAGADLRRRARGAGGSRRRRATPLFCYPALDELLGTQVHVKLQSPNDARSTSA
jgi:hypothetical protein